MEPTNAAPAAPAVPQPIRTESIDLNRVDIPADTREHDPQEIELTARNLLEIGQLQAIAVLEKEGGRFDVIFGKGRVLASRKAGRTQIKADIYQSLTPYQRLEMMYSENKRAEKPNPIYEAGLLQGMLDSGQFKTQGALARQKGMADSVLSDYLGFLKFPGEALEIFAMAKITYRALREVKTLAEDKQIQIAQELKAGTLKPGDVMKRCKKLISGKGKAPATIPTDPFAGIWTSLKADPAVPPENWEVHYKGGGDWVFTLHTKGIHPGNVMSDWSGLMFKSMPRSNAERGMGNAELGTLNKENLPPHSAPPTPHSEGPIAPQTPAPGPVTMTPEEYLASLQKCADPELAAHLKSRFNQIQAARAPISESAVPAPNEPEPEAAATAPAPAEARTEKLEKGAENIKSAAQP